MPLDAVEKTKLEALIIRVARKDRLAFEILYSQTQSHLLAIAFRVLGNAACAEDAMQETYVKIWNKAALFKSNDCSPMGWLISITRNTAIDIKRRKRDVAVGIDDLDLAADHAANPEETAIWTSQSRKLKDQISSLSPDRAALIKEVFFKDRTYREMADAMNIPSGTLKTSVRRSLMRMREASNISDMPFEVPAF